MPVYKLKSNVPETIYFDQVFLPGIETASKRYINLTKYPNLKKISDEPFQQDLMIFDDVTAVGQSGLNDFYRSIVLRVVDGVPGSGAGETVNASILAGDTDNIKDFIIFRELVFTKKTVLAGISLWGSNANRIENVETNAFKFYYVVITSISVTAPIKIYAKTII